MNKKSKKPIHKGVANVPVMMQMEALECGAASLDMILAYYGKWIPLEQVRADCGVSRDGSKANNIMKAARNYGFTVKGYRYEPEDIRTKGTFPCIIHWNFNHFVVLCGFRGNKAVINDPAGGRYAVPLKMFDESFTGICLTFAPNDSFVPGGAPKSMLRFAKNRLTGAGTAIMFLLLTTLITSLIGILKPAFARAFMDRILTGTNNDWLTWFVAGLSVVCFVEFIISAISMCVTYRINGKLASYGYTSFMWKVLRMPMEFFSQRMAGDIQLRQESNAGIAETFVTIFAPMALNFLMMLFYLIVMVLYSPLLSAIGMISIIVNIIMSQVIAKKRINITRVAMRDAGNLAGTTIAGIEMIETIKSSGAENGFFEKWSGYQASVNTQKIRFAKLTQYMGFIPQATSSFINLCVLAVGIYLSMSGEFTVGMIMAFQGVMTAFMTPVNTLISAGQQIQEMRTQMERVEDVMLYPTDVNYTNLLSANDSVLDKLTGKIELKDVSFGYSRLEEPLIRKFNLTLKPGSRVAFVGSSGCGKSTLSKLISGLYRPWSGEILYDGKHIDEIDRSVFTGSISVVDQDVVVFEDTIANNIKLWDNSIEDFEMIMAARDAKIHEDIMQRPGGYQYQLTEGGTNLSGGQRQRLEIARVLAGDPTVIIMDEATSALDAKTEYEVVKSIKDRGITCIVIAHRLSTIRDCDEIIVLDRGMVVDRGTHDELYAKGGLYTDLVSNE